MSEFLKAFLVFSAVVVLSAVAGLLSNMFSNAVDSFVERVKRRLWRRK